jgi:hypothetical protein
LGSESFKVQGDATSAIGTDSAHGDAMYDKGKVRDKGDAKSLAFVSECDIRDCDPEVSKEQAAAAVTEAAVAERSVQESGVPSRETSCSREII